MLYNAINWAFNPQAATDQDFTIGTSIVSAFLCPSDGNIPVGTVTYNGLTRNWGYTSYPNNVGTIYTNNGGHYDGPAYMLGSATYGPTVTFANITDGLSNTAMWSEWVRGQNLGTPQAGLNLIYAMPMALSTTYVLPITYLNSCKSATIANTPLYDSKGRTWPNHNCDQGGGYSHIMTPNLKACDLASNGGGAAQGTFVGASSYHPGGVNVAFMDGSVHFIKSSVATQSWWALATMAGGEVLSADSY